MHPGGQAPASRLPVTGQMQESGTNWGRRLRLGAAGGGQRWRCPPSRRPRGYLNNPEATTAVIGRDGWLTIADRVKELIKCKGLQVAPAELEAILMTHPQVAGCAVTGVPDEEAGEVPKASVVLPARLRRQGGPRLRRRAGSAVQAHPAHRLHAADPQPAIGEGPQAPAPLS